MSFIYSQALVAASSLDKCSDTDASAPSSGNPTPKPCLWHDKTMEVSRLSRYGMTCKPLTDTLGEELLTSWLAGFPARTSALPEKAQGLTGLGLECGGTWRGSLAKFDPVSSSWRTAQPSLLGDLEESSVTWPRSGMTAAGLCWELPMLEPLIDGIGSGSWAFQPGLTQKPTHNIPTPTASDHIERRSTSTETLNFDTNKTVSLDRWAKHWPTPTVCGNHNRKGASATSGDGLATAVKKWPTPVANDSKNSTFPPSAAVRDSIPGALLRDGVPPGGQLNPTWVEWLMGWPLGWTDLKPLATAKCHSAPPQLSATYPQPLSEQAA